VGSQIDGPGLGCSRKPAGAVPTSVVGNLTMHGVTREVKLKAVVQGTDVDS
jgi:polyisoprenoid-binding protein YceI